jgi:hypothetical protein
VVQLLLGLLVSLPWYDYVTSWLHELLQTRDPILKQLFFACNSFIQPGLLFHHETETKDYFHDWLKEWVHYIPVQTNLNDLRAKYEWAESHSNEAKKISKQATEFLLWMGSVDGFETLYKKHLVEPLRMMVESYEPLKGANKSVLELIKEEAPFTHHFEIIANYSGKTEQWREEVIGRNYWYTLGI